MNVRERIEEQEYKILSPLAAKSAESIRDHEEQQCDFRTAYQRDRDRIIHSKSFRRLKHKTQVYITPGDHYRMRMTHSLEVAQISRTIARGLRLNEDLVEAAALGHDVGHTPFGHAGEDALESLVGHFRHNEQSLRVVEVLERDGRGLNLTVGVRDAILNHTGSGVPITLEGRIVKLTDRIAYLCHDYDDGLRAGMLRREDLPKVVQEVLGTNPSAMITAMVSDIIIGSMDQSDIIVSPKIKMAMDEFRRFMFSKIYHSEQLAEERRNAVFIIEHLYNHFLKNFESMPAEFRSREADWGRKVVVTDYIAGLTDLFAVELFNKIFIPSIRIGV